ncbi:SMI1/KNR4 family protein [Streptomyces sp. HUAS MG91]|uniref:SMI1/KNR4 family protein n=1 Tax=Streptomyces tabacisoli TaxID=3156398 RepID=A0AAU8IJF9_9ACTN
MDDITQRDIEQRQIGDAWRRIESWLSVHAPGTLDRLIDGASESQLSSFGGSIGVRIPVGLKELWRQRAGSGPDLMIPFMPGPCLLMSLDVAQRVYQRKMAAQTRRGSAAERVSDGHEPVTIWRAAWIPFGANDVDALSGLLLDAETGKIWEWDETPTRTLRYDSLTEYVEEMADVLEVPSLAVGDRPGLMDGQLWWGEPENPSERAQWEPFTG